MNLKGRQIIDVLKKWTRNKLVVALAALIVLFSASFLAGAVFSKFHNKAIPAANLTFDDNEKQNKEDEAQFMKTVVMHEALLLKKSDSAIRKVLIEEERKNAQNKPQGGGYTDPLYVPDGSKVAYLTFDDGPTRNVTPRILETLKQYDVKATFFVIGNMAENNKDLVLREHNEGHAVANHTYTHDYKLIYENTQNLLDDFGRCESLLKSIIEGYSSKIVRFPGGSFGGKMDPFRRAVTQAGYRYVDWNALNSDADAKMIPKGSYSLPADKLLENLKASVAGKQHVVILMHDAAAKGTTADALPRVIEYLKSQGYTFKTLEE